MTDSLSSKDGLSQVRTYRKKPVIIYAMRVPERPGECDELAEWLAAQCEDYVIHEHYVTIGTLEGEMRANVGDWIIRGVAGEFYPCKPAIFEATYDPAE